MKQILIINQGLLRCNELTSDFSELNSFDLEMLEKFSRTGYFSTSSQLGLMPRAGINNLPFNNSVVDHLSAKMPSYDSQFNKTWEEITNQRCDQIKKIIQHTGKTLVVQWSGGIDSTCVMVSILKNFTPEDRNQVIVACNWGGVLEFPDFYFNHILPNFRTVDINDFTVNEYTKNHSNYLVVNGMPADVLLQSVAGLDLCMILGDDNILTRSWRTDPDKLIEYLSKITNSVDFGRWYFELLAENIESVDVPIETYFDFTWWGGFNYHWVSQILFEWWGNHSNKSISWEDHRASFYYWYDTPDYQKWAMVNNRPGIKHGNHLGQLKLVSKQYINEYVNNPWYFKYKIKMGSPGRNTQTVMKSRAFALCNDFDILTLDFDIKLIKQSLPDYLRKT